MHSAEPAPSQLRRLQISWAIIAALWTVVLALVFLTLQTGWPFAGRWLLLSAATSLYCLGVLWRRLPENHPPDDKQLLATLGYGNGLTVFRALCLSLIAGFIFGPWPSGLLAWIIALTYTVAAVADFLDGYVARITKHVTDLGEILDMEYDGLAMVVVTLLAVSFCQLPWWYLLLGFARYFFVFGLWVRERRQLPTYALQPSIHRRIFAGFQMGFMAAAIWPIVPVGAATIAGVTFGTLTTIGFLRDWLVVIGRIDPSSSLYQQWQRRLFILFKWRLPVLCRAVVVGGMLVLISRNTPWYQPTAWTALFANYGVPEPEMWAAFFVLIGIVAVAGVVLGAAARLAAFALVFPVGFTFWTVGVTGINSAMLVVLLLIMALGPGKPALWPVEERYVVRRAGDDS
ncbi:MAG: CDP-alcohol phosphatidyltransferase family protein [Anaerolineae bacterium]|nr:CDP-alcohol phosphatidyltransferase family protein [Anaerolineae bacterium]